MKLLLMVGMVVGLWAGDTFAAHTSSVETAECSPRNNYCGQHHSIENTSDIPCLAKMEAAMREVDQYFLTESVDVGSYDGCNHCGNGLCTTMACDFGPGKELRRLEWEVEQAKKQVSHAKHQAEALQQWVMVKKECWRQP